MHRETKMKRSTLAAFVLATFVVATVLFAPDGTRAADAERGQLLYENHCTVCHTSIVHIRERRKATSRDDIRMWIRRWQQHLQLQWGATEVDDVADFLNARFYGFKNES
jgi:cytochrome c5